MKVGYHLVHFKSEVDIVTLSDQIEIRKIVSTFEFAGTEATGEHWCACFEGDDSVDIKNLGDALICGLRLFKTGPVGIEEGYIKEETSPSDLPEDQIPDLWTFRPDVEVSGTYTLQKNELKSLKKFFKKFRNLRRIKDPLAHAILRFNRGIESDSPREAFVDLMIALEVLFLEGRTGEIRYKLGNRVASLIGGKESYEFSSKVKKLYDLRSKIVHSGGVSYKELQKKRAFLESLARKSLLSVIALRQNVPPKKLPTKLDECMHDPHTRKMLRRTVRNFWQGVDFPANVQMK